MDPEQKEEEVVFDPFGLRDQPKKKAEPKQEEQQQQQQQEEPDYKAFYEKYNWINSDAAEELKPLIEAQEGEDKVKSFVDKSKQVLTSFEEIQKKEAEREKWFREHSIQHSREFHESYQKPVEKALDLYNGLLGETDDEGKPRNEEMWRKLRETVFNKGNEVTVSQVKKMLSDYSSAYTKRFGQEPNLPTVKEVMDARDMLIDRELKKLNAIDNWEAEQEQRQEQTKRATLEQIAERRKTIIAERDEQLKMVVRDFDYDQYKDYFQPDDIKANFSEIHDRVKRIINGEEKEIQYNEYLELYAKAKLFDKLMPEAAKAKKFMEEYRKGNPGTIKSGDRQEDHKQTERKAGEVSELSSFLKVI